MYVFTLNRHQSIFKVYSVNPKSFVAKLWLQDKDEKYIDTEWVRQLTFDNEGALYVNESDGTAQVYRYGKNGTLVGKVTKGKSDVAQLYGVTASGELIYSLASPTPADRVIIAQDKKGKQRFLSPKDGVSSVVFSKDMSYYLLAHSSATEVPRYEIRRTRDAKVVKLLEDNSKLSATLAQYKMPKKEFMTLKIADGTELSAWMIKPSNFDPSKRYPVVMTQYSGPGSQEVKNEYEADWTTAMAEEALSSSVSMAEGQASVVVSSRSVLTSTSVSPRAMIRSLRQRPWANSPTSMEAVSASSDGASADTMSSCVCLVATVLSVQVWLWHLQATGDSTIRSTPRDICVRQTKIPRAIVRPQCSVTWMVSKANSSSSMVQRTTTCTSRTSCTSPRHSSPQTRIMT